MTSREALKALCRAVAACGVMPALLSFHVRRLVLGADRALEGSTQALAVWPGLPGQYLRRAFLMRVLAQCDSTATIEFGTVFSQTGARIGAHAYIGPRCHIGLAHIEQGVLIAAAVHVPSGAHTHDTRSVDTIIRDQSQRRTIVTIGAGSWIGSAAVVMADVGRNSVIGAGSVVTHPVEDDVVAAGVPARVIRRRR